MTILLLVNVYSGYFCIHLISFRQCIKNVDFAYFYYIHYLKGFSITLSCFIFTRFMYLKFLHRLYFIREKKTPAKCSVSTVYYSMVVVPLNNRP